MDHVPMRKSRKPRSAGFPQERFVVHVNPQQFHAVHSVVGDGGGRGGGAVVRRARSLRASCAPVATAPCALALRASRTPRVPAAPPHRRLAGTIRAPPPWSFPAPPLRRAHHQAFGCAMRSLLGARRDSGERCVRSGAYVARLARRASRVRASCSRVRVSWVPAGVCATLSLSERARCMCRFRLWALLSGVCCVWLSRIACRCGGMM